MQERIRWYDHFQWLTKNQEDPSIAVFNNEEETEEAQEQAWQKPAWWHPQWKAEATPAPPTTANLIPVVTTTDTIDAVELAQTYIRSWPVQENIIKDWLLPLGLDTNHGYAKSPTVNSEVNKEHAALEKRLSNVKQRAARPEIVLIEPGCPTVASGNRPGPTESGDIGS